MNDMTDKRVVLQLATQALRDVNSLADFVVALRTGAAIAERMLRETETRLLDVMDRIGDAPQ
jgi:hypothetical protein